jgi:hypothetical protein
LRSSSAADCRVMDDSRVAADSTEGSRTGDLAAARRGVDATLCTSKGRAALPRGDPKSDPTCPIRAIGLSEEPPVGGSEACRDRLGDCLGSFSWWRMSRRAATSISKSDMSLHHPCICCTSPCRTQVSMGASALDQPGS